MLPWERILLEMQLQGALHAGLCEGAAAWLICVPIHNTLTTSLEVTSINSIFHQKKPYSIIFNCVCALRMHVCASLHCTLTSIVSVIVSYTIGSQPMSCNPFGVPTTLSQGSHITYLYHDS